LYYLKRKKERKSTATNAIFTTPYETKKCGPKTKILNARHIFILYTIYGVKAITISKFKAAKQYNKNIILQIK